MNTPPSDGQILRSGEIISRDELEEAFDLWAAQAFTLPRISEAERLRSRILLALDIHDSLEKDL